MTPFTFRPLATAVVALLLATVPGGVRATPQDRPADRRDLFRSHVDLISVTATVVDRDGGLVSGLPAEAFEVFEDGQRQTITQFTNERVPVSVAVLLDVSDSMFGQRLVDARVAVEQFLFELLDPSDEFALVSFNHEPRPLTPWTRSHELVSGALARLRPFGSTALYDAAIATLPMMETRTRQRAALLVISDGADTASDATMHNVRSALLRSDAFSYAIAIDSSAKRAINTGVNVAALNDLTSGSGGRTEVVKDTADLGEATRHIADELNHQYVIGYTSSQAMDGKYHSIRVHAVNPDYRVRARNGYVATPKPTSPEPTEP